MSRTKKTVIVDDVIVNSKMWAEEWEKGERGKSQRVGQLLPDRGLEWMGICHHEQEIALQVSWGSLLFFARGSVKLHVHCVNINFFFFFFLVLRRAFPLLLLYSIWVWRRESNPQHSSVPCALAYWAMTVTRWATTVTQLSYDRHQY